MYELLLNSHVSMVDNIYNDRRDLSQRVVQEGQESGDPKFYRDL